MKLSDKLIQEKIGFSPTPPQQEILSAFKAKRDVTICAGTRFGKSKLCGYVAFKQLLADNQRIWIVSLTYDMAKKIFDYVVDFAGQWDKELLKGLMNKQTRLEVKEWNSWIECKSADNETSLMGEELDLAILDEAARMKPDIWERYITARLASRQGKSLVISTPFGQNWFYTRYLQTQEAEDGASFHFTSKDNPYFPPEEWERARVKLPQNIFQQEYEAAFLADAAQVFRNVKNCISDDCYSDPKSGHRYIMGLDVAKFNDFTVITIIDKLTHHVVFWDRFQKIPYPLQVQRISDVTKKYSCEIVIDAMNVGAAMGDTLRAEGFMVTDFKAVGSTNADREIKGNKEQSINKLNTLFEENNITIPPEPVLIGELETYGYKLTPMGNVQYGAPEGLHDDCVSSLCLAVWQLHGKAKKEIIKATSLIPPRIKKFQYF